MSTDSNLAGRDSVGYKCSMWPLSRSIDNRNLRGNKLPPDFQGDPLPRNHLLKSWVAYQTLISPLKVDQKALANSQLPR